MKTIVARFQELKKNVGEIEIDGEIVDVNKIDTALKSVGVALRDDVTGQFRDLDDVFLELSQKWDTLDRNTQRYVATVAAGSRQQSRFLAMMDNYERTVELVNIANDSAGASSAQFDKTLGSIDSKINKIKASGEEIVGNLADNQFVKDTLDFDNKIMQVFAKISEQGPIAMLAFAAVAYKVIKNIANGGIDGIKLVAKEYDNFLKKIENTKTRHTIIHTHVHQDQDGNPVDPTNGQPTSPVPNSVKPSSSNQSAGKDSTGKEISRGVQALSSMTKTLGSILSVVSLIKAQSTSGMIGSTIGQGVGSIAGSLVSLIPGWGAIAAPLITPIFGMLGRWIGDSIDKSKGILSEAYQKSINDFAETINQQKIDFNEENSGLIELAKEFDNLNNKTELTAEESNRLAEINTELAKIDGSLVSSRNAEGKILSINSDALDKRIKQLEQESLLLNTMSGSIEYAQFVIDNKKEEEKIQKYYQNEELEIRNNPMKNGYQSYINAYSVLAGGISKEIDYQIFDAVQNLDFDEIKRLFEGIDTTNFIASQKSYLDNILDSIEYNKENFQTPYEDLQAEKEKKTEELKTNTQEKILEINDEAVTYAISQPGSEVVSNYSDIVHKYVDNNSEVQKAYNELNDMLTDGTINVDNLDDVNSEDYKAYQNKIQEIINISQTTTNNIIGELEGATEGQLEALSRATSLKGFIDKKDIKKYLKKNNFTKEFITAFVDNIGEASTSELGNVSESMRKVINELFNEGKEGEAGKLAFSLSEWENSDKDIDTYIKTLNYLKEEFGENSDAVNIFSLKAIRDLKSFGYSLDDIAKRTESLNNKIKILQELEDAALQGTLSIEQKNKLIQDYGLVESNFEQTANGFKLIGTSIQELISIQEELARNEALEKYNTQVNLFQSRMANYGDSRGIFNEKGIWTYQQLFDALRDGTIVYDELTENEKVVADKAIAAGNAISYLGKQIKNLDKEIQNNTYDAFITGLKEINNLSSEIQSAYSALKEFNENGQVSLDTVLNLIAANEDYIQCIDVVNGVLTINKDKVNELIKAETDAYIQEIKLDNARIEKENEVLGVLVQNEQNKINTINDTLSVGIKSQADYNNTIEKLQLEDNNAKSQIEASYNSWLEEQTTSTNNDILNSLHERAIEEAKIIKEMSDNWSKYYIAMTTGETVDINANIKKPSEITVDYFNNKNYESYLSDLYNGLSIDNIALYYGETSQELIAASETALKAIKTDAEISQKALQEQLKNNKTLIANNNKRIELLSSTDFLSSGGTKNSAKEQKEYNLELDKFYNILSKIAQAKRDINDLDRDREKYSNYEDLAKIDAKRISASKSLEEHYQTLLILQKIEQKNLEKQLSQYSNYVTVRDGYLEVNHGAIEGIKDEKLGEALEKLIEEYDDLAEAINETNESIKTENEYQKEILKSSREYSQTLKDQLLQMVIKAHEEEIQAVKDKYAAIKKADDDYLSTLRENIQKQRDLRNQEDEQKELEKMEKRLALLRRDTSGIYANEIAQLEEEITQKRQDMADQQQDQIIQEIENEQKAQQERMDQETEFLDAQHQENLDSMTAYWAEVEEIMKGGYDNILSYLKDNDEEFITGSEEAQTTWLETWKKNIDEALAYKELLQKAEVADSESSAKIGTDKSSATDPSLSPVPTTSTPATSGATVTKTKPDNGERVTLKDGNRKIYTGTSDTKGSKPAFGVGPYTVLKVSGNRAQVRVSSAKSGVTGWFNINDLTGYSAGGYVTETGPVMVHGTPNKPEAFLSAMDVKLIEGLKDSLRYIVKVKEHSSNKPISEKNGDIYYEIHIEVDELNSDYSVNEMMAAIEKKIVNDARGRNVIAIKRSR